MRTCKLFTPPSPNGVHVKCICYRVLYCAYTIALYGAFTYTPFSDCLLCFFVVVLGNFSYWGSKLRTASFYFFNTPHLT